jgi:predicted transcriptional regulator
MRKRNKVAVSFRLRPDMIKVIDLIAKENKVNRTDVVEAALVSFFEYLENAQKRKDEAHG